jgi:hypothetical protein
VTNVQHQVSTSHSQNLAQTQKVVSDQKHDRKLLVRKQQASNDRNTQAEESLRHTTPQQWLTVTKWEQNS